MSVDIHMYRHNGTRSGGQSASAESRGLGVARSAGILRARDFTGHGIPRVVLTRLVRKNLLKRTERGIYMLPNSDITEHHTIAEACKKVPHGVVCLLSALRFHRMTTQNPSKVWMAIDVSARKPLFQSPPLRIVRFSGKALTYGVEKKRIEGVDIIVTSRAKTVADCFKYRNKIGMDVALESLREYRRSRGSPDDLWRSAEVCRIASIIRPYWEAIS